MLDDFEDIISSEYPQPGQQEPPPPPKEIPFHDKLNFDVTALDRVIKAGNAKQLQLAEKVIKNGKKEIHRRQSLDREEMIHKPWLLESGNIEAMYNLTDNRDQHCPRLFFHDGLDEQIPVQCNQFTVFDPKEALADLRIFMDDFPDKTEGIWGYYKFENKKCKGNTGWHAGRKCTIITCPDDGWLKGAHEDKSGYCINCRPKSPSPVIPPSPPPPLEFPTTTIYNITDDDVSVLDDYKPTEKKKVKKKRIVAVESPPPPPEEEEKYEYRPPCDNLLKYRMCCIELPPCGDAEFTCYFSNPDEHIFTMTLDDLKYDFNIPLQYLDVSHENSNRVEPRRFISSVVIITKPAQIVLEHSKEWAHMFYFITRKPVPELDVVVNKEQYYYSFTIDEHEFRGFCGYYKVAINGDVYKGGNVRVFYELDCAWMRFYIKDGEKDVVVAEKVLVVYHFKEEEEEKKNTKKRKPEPTEVKEKPKSKPKEIPNEKKQRVETNEVKGWLIDSASGQEELKKRVHAMGKPEDTSEEGTKIYLKELFKGFLTPTGKQKKKTYCYQFGCRSKSNLWLCSAYNDKKCTKVYPPHNCSHLIRLSYYEEDKVRRMLRIWFTRTVGSYKHVWFLHADVDNKALGYVIKANVFAVDCHLKECKACNIILLNPGTKTCENSECISPYTCDGCKHECLLPLKKKKKK